MNLAKTIILSFSLFLGIFSGYAQDSYKEYVEKGMKAHDSGDYKGAIEEYGNALKIHPSSMQALYEMGFSYYYLKDYDGAITCFQKAVDARQDTFNVAMIYSIWGSLLDDMAEPDKAITILNKGLEIDSLPTLLFNKGVIYTRMAKNEIAEDCYRAALKKDPLHLNSLYQLVQMQHSQGDEAGTFFMGVTYLLFASGNNYACNVLKLVLGEDQTVGKERKIVVPNDSSSSWSLLIGVLRQCVSLPDSTAVNKSDGRFHKLLSILDNLKKSKDILKVSDINDALSREVYIPFIFSICDNNYTDVCAAIASSSCDPQAVQWLKEHEERLKDFLQWVKN